MYLVPSSPEERPIRVPDRCGRTTHLRRSIAQTETPRPDRPAFSVGGRFFFAQADRMKPDSSSPTGPTRPSNGQRRGAPGVGYPAHPPLYNPDFEHDGCGTGFIASLERESSHRIVELGLRALVNLTHRGAVSSDAASGDGAGVTIQLPREMLADDATRLGLANDELERLAVAMVFLPPDEGARPAARAILEEACVRGNIEVLGWREVPIDPSVLGGLALESLPGIEQLLLARPHTKAGAEFDRALYLARRRAEGSYREQGVEAYIASMSSRTVVYKGLMVAPQLGHFFPDLEDARTRSSLVLFHQRFATNTLPSWRLAQPFRLVAHNGEINTLLGNRNWMSAREPELTSPVWGHRVRDLIPVIKPIGSDTASLDEAFELLLTSGRDLLHAMAMLIPEAWENMSDMDADLRAFYEYHTCLMEPWDGPAAVAFTDGVVAAAVMDRNGLRPARYKVTTDGLVVMSSEVGLLELLPGQVVESGRVGPGEMIAVDTARRRFLHNHEIKKEVARPTPTARGYAATSYAWTRRSTRPPARCSHCPSWTWSGARRFTATPRRRFATSSRPCRSRGRNPWAPWATTRPRPC